MVAGLAFSCFAGFCLARPALRNSSRAWRLGRAVPSLVYGRGSEQELALTNSFSPRTRPSARRWRGAGRGWPGPVHAVTEAAAKHCLAQGDFMVFTYVQNVCIFSREKLFVFITSTYP